MNPQTEQSTVEPHNHRLWKFFHDNHGLTLTESELNDIIREIINAPELHDFSSGVVLEAAHQRERWGSEHDAGKTPSDWFWLVGYLAGKALHSQTSGKIDKALHHTISTAAALANWHASLMGANQQMRPGIDPVARGIEQPQPPTN